jgi:hypothetical protein
VKRRIQFENPYDLGRTFRVYSSDPTRLSVKSEFHHLEPRDRAEFELDFNYPALDSKRKEVEKGNGARAAQLLLFVENVDSGQQEEAYEIMVEYE